MEGRKKKKKKEGVERIGGGKSGGKELEGGSNEPIRRGNENSSKGSLYS